MTTHLNSRRAAAKRKRSAQRRSKAARHCTNATQAAILMAQAATKREPGYVAA